MYRPQIRQCSLALALLLLSISGISQQVYWMPGDPVNHTLRRMEVLAPPHAGKPIFTTCWPAPRSADWMIAVPNGTKSDQWNEEALRLGQLRSDSAVVDSIREVLVSAGFRKRNWGPFFHRPTQLYEAHVKDFDLIINPVLAFGVGTESGSGERLFENTRGVVVDGQIAGKIGFHSYLTENQERLPGYAREWEIRR